MTTSREKKNSPSIPAIRDLQGSCKVLHTADSSLCNPATYRASYHELDKTKHHVSNYFFFFHWNRGLTVKRAEAAVKHSRHGFGAPERYWKSVLVTQKMNHGTLLCHTVGFTYFSFWLTRIPRTTSFLVFRNLCSSRG